MSQHTWQGSPSYTAHCSGYGASRLHNPSLPADVGYCSFQAPSSQVSPPTSSVDTQSCASCRSSSVSTHQLYLITQIKPQDLMLFMPKEQIRACVGTYDCNKLTGKQHLAATWHASYPMDHKHMRNTSTSIKQERFSWGTCRMNLPGNLLVPSKAASI